jgi:co-chaperonin GroES (HSP10)
VKKTKGGIELPNFQIGIEKTMEGTGTVLRVGSRVNDSMSGLEAGQRICYRGFLKDASSMEFETIDDCPVFMIRVEDVLAIIDADVKMGAFS